MVANGVMTRARAVLRERQYQIIVGAELTDQEAAMICRAFNCSKPSDETLLPESSDGRAALWDTVRSKVSLTTRKARP